MFINLPQAIPAGNSVEVAFQYGSSTVTATGFQVTTDQGDTLTGNSGASDGTNGESCALWYAINLAAPVKQIRIKNVSGGDIQYVGPVHVSDMNDVTAIDVVHSNTAAGSNAATAGSLAVTQTDDFITMHVWRDHNIVAGSFTPTAHANITWRQLAPNLAEGSAWQAGQYFSSAAINPQIDMTGGAGAPDWLAIAAAYKTGTSGSPAPTSGVFINGINHVNGVGRSGFGNPLANPFGLPTPAIGKFICIMQITGINGSGTPSVISDTSNNQWTKLGPIENNGSDNILFAQNPTPSQSLSISLTLNDAACDGTWMIYDVSQIHPTDAFESYVSVMGNQSYVGDTYTYTLAGSVPGCLILGQFGLAFGTVNGLRDSSIIFDTVIHDGEPLDGPSNSDENNGWAHVIPQDTSSKIFMWTKTTGSGAALQFAGQGIVFRPDTYVSPIRPGMKGLLLPNARRS